MREVVLSRQVVWLTQSEIRTDIFRRPARHPLNLRSPFSFKTWRTDPQTKLRDARRMPSSSARVYVITRVFICKSKIFGRFSFRLFNLLWIKVSGPGLIAMSPKIVMFRGGSWPGISRDVHPCFVQDTKGILARWNPKRFATKTIEGRQVTANRP